MVGKSKARSPKQIQRGRESAIVVGPRAKSRPLRISRVVVNEDQESSLELGDLQPARHMEKAPLIELVHSPLAKGQKSWRLEISSSSK